MPGRPLRGHGVAVVVSGRSCRRRGLVPAVGWLPKDRCPSPLGGILPEAPPSIQLETDKKEQSEMGEAPLQSWFATF